MGHAFHGVTLILLWGRSSQAYQNLGRIYPSFVVEDAEDQTSADFVAGDVGDQASGHVVVRTGVESVELEAFHFVDGVAAFEAV